MEPSLIPDVVTQQEESDELIDDDEIEPEQEPTTKVKKARARPTVERLPGHSLLSLTRVEAVIRGDGMNYYDIH